MSDVAPQERVADPDPSRRLRVRCVHCAMPVGGARATCWSCGLEPTGAGDADPPQPVPGTAGLPAPWSTVLLVTCAVTLVVVALLGTVLMVDPHVSSQGPRGLAARFHGERWLRAELGGAAAEFPSRPIHATASPAPGTTGTTEVLVATAPGVRVELRAHRLDAPLSPAEVIDAYGDASGQHVRRSAPVDVGGAPALDAPLDGPHGQTRVRAVVTSSSAYLLAVTGPAAAFERVAASFTAAS